jgi:hypothetical protein
MMSFDPANWYWIVAGDETQLWSSAAGSTVAADDATHVSWRAAGGRPTRIANAFELDQVLRQHGMTLGRSFTAAEMLEALGRIDAAKLKAKLGRDDVRPGSLVAGDADKLRVLAQQLQPKAPDGTPPAAPPVDGSARPMTLEERLAKLEETRAEAAG